MQVVWHRGLLRLLELLGPGIASYVPRFVSATSLVQGTILDNGTNVAIGTTPGAAKLEIAGTVKITGGSPGAGKVLTSDATGLASWTSLAGVNTGTTNKIPKYTNTSTLGDGTLYDNGGIGIGVATPHPPFAFYYRINQ